MKRSLKKMTVFLLINLFCTGIFSLLCGALITKGLLKQNCINAASVCIVFLSCVIAGKAYGIPSGKKIVPELLIRTALTTGIYSILHLCIMYGEGFQNPFILAGIACGTFLGMASRKRGVRYRYR